MRVLNTRQMREADRVTIDEIGTPSLVLMENAGRHVAEAMTSIFDELAARRVTVLCGRGNNGGDGLVVARALCQEGVAVEVFLFGSAADVSGDVRANLDALSKVGLTVSEVTDTASWRRCRTGILRARIRRRDPPFRRRWRRAWLCWRRIRGP